MVPIESMWLKKMKLVLGRVENIVGNEINAGHLQMFSFILVKSKILFFGKVNINPFLNYKF